jgi:hypothetical protein
LVTAVLCTVAYFSPIGIQIVPAEESAEISEDKNKENEDGDEDGDEILDEDDPRVEAWLDAYFLPLTRPTLTERKYYRQEDPEWKMYAAFSRERDRHKKVHGMLVSTIYVE